MWIAIFKLRWINFLNSDFSGIITIWPLPRKFCFVWAHKESEINPFQFPHTHTPNGETFRRLKTWKEVKSRRVRATIFPLAKRGRMWNRISPNSSETIEMHRADEIEYGNLRQAGLKIEYINLSARAQSWGHIKKWASLSLSLALHLHSVACEKLIQKKVNASLRASKLMPVWLCAPRCHVMKFACAQIVIIGDENFRRFSLQHYIVRFPKNFIRWI